MKRRDLGVALAIGLVAEVYGAGIADKTVVGAWFFDKDEKGVVTDASSMGHVGKIQGNTVWVKDGKFGGALEFPGVDSTVLVDDHPSFQFKKGDDFTLAAWIRTTMNAGSPPMIVAKNYQPAETRPWYALYYANNAKALDGSVSVFLRDVGGANYFITATTKVNDDKWHHVAATREKGKLRLFVDGKEEASMDNADVDVGTNAAPLHFMSHLNRWLVGFLDEVFIVRRALSDAELQGLKNQGISSYLAVEPKDKLTTTWASLRE